MRNLREFRYESFAGEKYGELLAIHPSLAYPFQLEVLEWHYTGTASEDVFLRSQRSLRHLGILFLYSHLYVQGRGSGDFPHHISSALESIRGGIGELLLLAPGRSIVAFDYHSCWYNDGLLHGRGRNKLQEALSRLKYMRVYELQSFAELSDRHAPTVSRIVLLHLRNCDVEVCRRFFLHKRHHSF